MGTVWQDVRHSVRLFVKQWSFSLVAVATLALGIGATTAVFGVVNAVLLRPRPYAEPERLVRVAERLPMAMPGQARGPAWFVTGDTFRAWQKSAATLEGIAAYAPRSYEFTGRGEPVRVRGTAVSASMFQMLKVAPKLGRLFDLSEDRAGSNQVAILSEALRARRFDRRMDIIGTPITLDGAPITVVGVLPASFYFPDRDSEMWTPLTPDERPHRPGERVVVIFSALARLKPGVSIAEAEGTVAANQTRSAEPPSTNAPEAPPVGVRLARLQDTLTEGVRPAVLALFAAVGGVAGVTVAYGLFRVLPAAAPRGIPRMDEAAIDGTVLAFAALTSIGTGLLFGLVPALQASRVNVLATLNEAGMSAMGGFRFLKGNRLRSALVVAEVALSLVLLVAARIYLPESILATCVSASAQNAIWSP